MIKLTKTILSLALLTTTAMAAADEFTFSQKGAPSICNSLAYRFNKVKDTKAWLIHVDTAVKWQRKNGYNINAFPALSDLMPPVLFKKLIKNTSDAFVAANWQTTDGFSIIWQNCVADHVFYSQFTPLEQLSIVEAATAYLPLLTNINDLTSYKRPEYNDLLPKITLDGLYQYPDENSLKALLSKISFDSFLKAVNQESDTFFNSTQDPLYSQILALSDTTQTKEELFLFWRPIPSIGDVIEYTVKTVLKNRLIGPQKPKIGGLRNPAETLNFHFHLMDEFIVKILEKSDDDESASDSTWTDTDNFSPSQILSPASESLWNFSNDPLQKGT